MAKKQKYNKKIWTSKYARKFISKQIRSGKSRAEAIRMYVSEIQGAHTSDVAELRDLERQWKDTLRQSTDEDLKALRQMKTEIAPEVSEKKRKQILVELNRFMDGIKENNRDDLTQIKSTIGIFRDELREKLQKAKTYARSR